MGYRPCYPYLFIVCLIIMGIVIIKLLVSYG